MSKKNKGWKNPNQIQQIEGNRWYNHYLQYLSTITYQLFEWKNLPDTIDPRYIEMKLHQLGYVAFYNDPILGYIVTQGAVSGQINHYDLPTGFRASSPMYQKQFNLFHYNGIGDNMGVLIGNNDIRTSSLEALQLFAIELSNLKEIIQVNANAQKTPVLISASDYNKLSLLNIYNQYEGNAPVIVTSENFDQEAIKVFKTDAPYVVDKLNVQKNAVWNEIMSFLGINNANQEKRERMITNEVDANNDQVMNSSNRMLKTRQEAVSVINKMFDLEIEVCLRNDVVDSIKENIVDVGGVV